MYAYSYYSIIESLKTNWKCEWSYSYPFFHFSSHQSDALKLGISNFLAKESPFSWIIGPSIGIFWLLCKTNHSNRVLSTFSYWKPRNFLVLGALSASAWKSFSLFLIQVEMVFLGTANLLAAFLFVMLFSVWQNVTLFLQSFRIQLTFDRHFCFDDTENKKQIFVFIYRQNFCFDSNSNLFRNSKMKYEYVNVRDREWKWFKGLENLFDIGKSSK